MPDVRRASGQEGTLQGRDGVQARETFERLVEGKLRRRSGRRHVLYIRSADEHIDSYGRLLAYVAPSYMREELLTMSCSERATFDLLMADSGWAASFPIYPSRPNYVDLVLLQQAGLARPAARSPQRLAVAPLGERSGFQHVVSG